MSDQDQVHIEQKARMSINVYFIENKLYKDYQQQKIHEIANTY